MLSCHYSFYLKTQKEDRFALNRRGLMKKATQFIKDLRFSDLDEATIQSAKNCLLDFIGAVLSGANTKAGEIALKFAKNSPGVGQSTLWPTGEKTSAQNAAFVHGTVGSALNIDDGHRMAVGHPGGVVIPAACAIAENNKSSGKELIEAIVCGYEVAIRSGDLHRNESSPFAVSPGSGRWGSMGAAAAVAKLLGLDSGKVEQAMAIGETFAPVSPIIDDLKRGFMPMTQFCSGWGALVGVSAALLAQEGFTGITSTIDFSMSFLPKFGESFEIKNIYFKPYPSCRWTHPSIEGTLELMKKHKELRKDTIKKISIRIFSVGSHLGEKRPQTMESAQYSLPFIIGATIADGVLIPEQFTEKRLTDPDILGIADKVELIHSPELDSYFPKAIPSEIEIETTSGKSYTTRVTTPKGDATNPMSTAEFLDKFRKLASRKINSKNSEKVIEIVRYLDKLAHVNELFDIF